MSAAQQASPRWPIEHFNVEEVADAEVIHARAHWGDDLTLCEQGSGDRLPWGTVARNLDVPMDPEQVERPVDCPVCLEWMHA